MQPVGLDDEGGRAGEQFKLLPLDWAAGGQRHFVSLRERDHREDAMLVGGVVDGLRVAVSGWNFNSRTRASRSSATGASCVRAVSTWTRSRRRTPACAVYFRAGSRSSRTESSSSSFAFSAATRERQPQKT